MEKDLNRNSLASVLHASDVGIHHTTRDCDVDSGYDLVKQRADEFRRAKKASDRREELKNRKRCKTDAVSGDISANNLMSLIDHSKLIKVPASVSNYILVDLRSRRLTV